MKSVLLSTSYLGPIQYYSKLISSERVMLEKFEHYPKQTYRNRCIIYAANGPQTLTIPVTKGNDLKIYTKDIRIDYAMNWQKLHFKAIESAYRCSPFYQYYMDEYISFFEMKYEFLYDFNLEIIHKTLEIIGFPIKIEESESYITEIPTDSLDFREIINPKKRVNVFDPSFEPPFYQQVFEPKHGFFGNLSIIDLLFNTGPDTIVHLNKSFIQ